MTEFVNALDSGPLFPPSRTDWFKQARFGMFIHWGLYSLIGRGEWAMNRESIPLKEYTLLASRFSAEDYQPKKWAALAKRAGMRYMILTAKHHEGFCLWNSRLCSFNAVNSAAKRDLMLEYVEAVRSEGLKVGIYYSLGDWYHPDWRKGWQGDAAAETRFMEYTHGLVRELMTGYGKIDVLWYDLPQCYSAERWRSVELNAMVRNLQPQILINNRALTTEDLATPEQHVAKSVAGRLWEACVTLNDAWGYRAADRNWKSPGAVARLLASVAAGGGNLLLNVGPDGAGRIPQESVTILQQVGNWLDRCGDAIYEVGAHSLPWLLCGSATTRDKTLYLFLFPYEGPATTLGGLTVRVIRASLLCSGMHVTFEQTESQLFLKGLPDAPPDDVLTVVKLELESIPDLDTSRSIGGADIFAEFPK